METNLPRIAPCAAVQFAGRRVNTHELAPWSVLTGVRGIPRHTGKRGAKQIQCEQYRGYGLHCRPISKNGSSDAPHRSPG
jgi:hypothetical protein